MKNERFSLACERLGGIGEENVVGEPYAAFFRAAAEFLKRMAELYDELEKKDWEKASLNSLRTMNDLLYREILPEHYDQSYANPAYAVSVLGEEFGNLLCLMYAELRSLIPFVFEQNQEAMVIRTELFLEVYHAFYSSYEENGMPPVQEEVRRILYWFYSDYSETEADRRIAEQLIPNSQFAVELIINSDLSDVKYLYRFGEYITENEIRTALFLQSLPEETIIKMADTFTEGFRKGFVNAGKDLSGKKTVNIRYSLGFERVIKRAIMNFGKMGLEPTIYRAGISLFQRRSTARIGYFGAVPNKQYDYDHKEDDALILDGLLVNRRLEVLRQAYEADREWAGVHAGPACMEVFGSEPFVPENKKEAPRLSEEQQKLAVEYASGAGKIVNEFIPGEERSFTIIAFPTPEIGKDFEKIFDEIIRINTLDYQLYTDIQQSLIETLDRADSVRIMGTNGNRTDLTVRLQKADDITKQTTFENCVADVNIPVGEVFTSPVLAGTDGILHVSRVYLNELEYRDLELHLKDGMTASYTCGNFETEEENKRYIRDNLLFHHESLPLGEFAIGTNTTAYVAAAKYGLQSKLPILIAEKMGPHFALGDTCYSHSEDVCVTNPDGREIIARDNEISLLRKTDEAKAYFNCHTDITIPYDELGRLSVRNGDGTEIDILINGRFVLPGTEKLNDPFLNY